MVESGPVAAEEVATVAKNKNAEEVVTSSKNKNAEEVVTS